MKKFITAAASIAMTFALAGAVYAAKPTSVDSNGVENGWEAAKAGCTTIQSGTLESSSGETLSLGFDQYGYNYQAHQYIGYYGNYQRPPAPVDYGYKLMMKWNDAWLSNTDCDGDLKLDRHLGFPSYLGSGAWLTNHMTGTNSDGSTWEDFVKIVAVSDTAIKESDATSCPTSLGLDGMMWYDNGVQVGCSVWGQFAVIQEVYNDSSANHHGILFNGEAPTGLGFY